MQDPSKGMNQADVLSVGSSCFLGSDSNRSVLFPCLLVTVKRLQPAAGGFFFFFFVEIVAATTLTQQKVQSFKN